MGIKHTYQSGTANDAGSEVSSTRWNENHTIDGQVSFPLVASPTAPAADNFALFGSKIAGQMLPSVRMPAGLSTALQPSFATRHVAALLPGNGGTPASIGIAWTTTATLSTQQTAGDANIWIATRRQRYQTSTTAGNASAARLPYAAYYRSTTANRGGFFFLAQFGTSINLNGGQCFIGLLASTGQLAGEPSALVNMCGCGYDSTDSSTGNWQFMRNDGTGTATKVDLGTNAARNTTDGFELAMFMAPGSDVLNVRIVNITTGTLVLDTTYTTDIPANNTLMSSQVAARNGAVAAANNVEVARIYIETDY